jgi:hypothetical protein
MARYYLTLSKAIDRRMRPDQTPLRQFYQDELPRDVIRRLGLRLELGLRVRVSLTQILNPTLTLNPTPSLTLTLTVTLTLTLTG